MTTPSMRSISERTRFRTSDTLPLAAAAASALAVVPAGVDEQRLVSSCAASTRNSWTSSSASSSYNTGITLIRSSLVGFHSGACNLAAK